jgi:adenine/guanine phosphoribosyltransferase-like PRPP-binding protein
MITWRNRPIEQMSRDELRLAVEDAANEMVRAHKTHGPDQVMTMLSCGFVTGAICATLIVSLLTAHY